MPQWYNKFVCQSYLVNRIVHQVIEDEYNNKDSNNQNFNRKVPEESVETI